MRFLGIDFETTGIDTETALITEYAAVMWDAPSNRILHSESHILCDQNQKSHTISQEIADITGLTEDLINENLPCSEANALIKLNDLISQSDLVCAYNGELFDFPLYHARAKVHLIQAKYAEIPNNKKCDLMLSVPWPRHLGSSALGLIAQAHGILNPSAHAALGDVLTMQGIASRYDPFEIKNIAESETITMIAEPRNREDWNAARLNGFKWNTFVKDELSYRVKVGMLERFKDWYSNRFVFPYCTSTDHRMWVSIDAPYQDREYAKERLYKWNPSLKQPLLRNNKPIQEWIKKLSASNFEREQTEAIYRVSEIKD